MNTTTRFAKTRIAAFSGALAVALAAGTALTAFASPQAANAATISPASSSVSASSSSSTGGDAMTSRSSFSMSVHITNNSSHDLVWVEDAAAYKHYGRITNTPLTTIPAGGSDTIDYVSSNVGGGEIMPTYELKDQPTVQIQGLFQIPVLGANEDSCGQITGPKAGLTQSCSISHGYTNVTGQWTIS